MADHYKILGQLVPLAGSLTILYTCPASTEAIISSIIVSNRSGTVETFDICVCSGGATPVDHSYIYRDIDIPGKDSFAATLGVTLQQSDNIRVGCDQSSGCAFSLFGMEKT